MKTTVRALFLATFGLMLAVNGLCAEQELIVSGAASLTNAFTDIGKKFEAANPGMKVVFNFAGSGALLQQIDKGAPVDIFASADQKTMDQAAEKKLIDPATRRDFVRNGLVLVAPKESPVKGVKDLAAKEVAKVALGNPDSVPAGRYAKDVLTNEGLWETLTSKYIFGDSVRQVLDYVSRGEVEAGFVFATDAVAAKDKVRVAARMESREPILYPIAVVAASERKDAARRFIDYLSGEEAWTVLSGYGFDRP